MWLLELLTDKKSFVRAGAYVVAQSGGAIAGASVVLGLYGNTGEAELSLSHGPGHRSSGLAQFGLEFLLAFMIVLAYLRVTDESQVDMNDSIFFFNS